MHSHVDISMYIIHIHIHTCIYTYIHTHTQVHTIYTSYTIFKRRSVCLRQTFVGVYECTLTRVTSTYSIPPPLWRLFFSVFHDRKSCRGNRIEKTPPSGTGRDGRDGTPWDGCVMSLHTKRGVGTSDREKENACAVYRDYIRSRVQTAVVASPFHTSFFVYPRRVDVVCG